MIVWRAELLCRFWVTWDSEHREDKPPRGNSPSYRNKKQKRSSQLRFLIPAFSSVVPRIGVEPTRLSTLAPETSASTISPPGPLLRCKGNKFLQLTTKNKYFFVFRSVRWVSARAMVFCWAIHLPFWAIGRAATYPKICATGISGTDFAKYRLD